ncbi:MAE_28990/MAE_18760 family HEPN-like nuclease [Bacteroides acidifaciens]|jgi:hypothetical protein|uniref:MAE_28990/MAE_18760 family HEPN-like nuclease n=1 Tax=Bacteroides acidifaciens TaxID=85831 RepID=UPI0025581799|nr:MAE_28990/MAE_18760 family HEPN-like nuclease [Bacteroides acidifaciens]
MQNTLGIFEDRKEEINFYYSIMIEIESADGHIETIDNNRLVKIMKSNLLLMLYNLVEACVVSGMMEIYEDLKNDGCSYNSVISEIQNIWAKNEINEIYGPTTERIAYENRVQRIIQNITSESPIILSRDALGVSGNLNAKKIKEICDRHRIRYRLETRGELLERVKLERNNLAHGDVSFSDCARNLSLSDLETIKNEVFLFIDGILKGMTDYYIGKQYRRP